MHGVNVMSYLTWIASTVVVAALGNLIPNPEKYGIDYALVAMFIGLLALTLDSMVKHEKLPVVLTVVVSAVLLYFFAGIIVSSYVAVLIATIVGALIGAIMTNPENKRVGEGI